MSDVLHGSSGTDLIKANADNTQIYGLKGNDTLTNGGKTNVILIGGGGDDSLIVNGGKTTLSGGDGSDVFELNYSATEPLFAVIEDADQNDKIVVNFDGNTTPQLSSVVSGDDVIWSDGNLFNLTLKSVRDNDYFDGNASDEIWQILKLTNDLRESQNLEQLTLADGLTEAASIRADEITELGIRGELDAYKHTRPGGMSYATVFDDIGKDYHHTGENITSGQSLPAGAMTQWINSASHYRNLTMPDFLKLGVGYNYNDTDPTNQRWYWEQLFADKINNPESVSAESLLSTSLDVNAVEKFTLGTDNADSFDNTINAETISALGGNDTITNSAVNVSISGGADDDSIISNGAFTTINAGTGNDTVNITGNGNVLLYTAGDGSDTIIGVDGNDTLKISGDEEFTPVTVGNNVIVGVGENSVTFVNAANVDLNIDGTRSKLFVGTENAETISATVDGATVQALGGNDSITSNANATITAGTGNDTVSLAGGRNVLLYTAGDGNDTVIGFGEDDSFRIVGEEFTPVTLGNDVILAIGDESISVLHAADVSLNVVGTRSKLFIGTNRADSITVIDNATVNAMRGNDTISLAGGENLLIYNAGDGNDSVFGFGADDTFSITGGEYTPDTVGNDVVLAVGDDSIRIRDAANLSLNIAGTRQDEADTTPPDTVDTSKLITLTEEDDNYTIKTDGVTVLALGGNDTIWNGYYDSSAGRYVGYYSNVSIDGGDGNDSIYNNGDSVTIDAGAGNDYITNGALPSMLGANVSISGGDGNDTVRNDIGDSVTIDGGAGNDSIFNWNGTSVTINGGAGDDYIDNQHSSNVSIDGGAGNDTIYNWEGSNVSINGGAGNDSIDNRHSNVSIDGGAGNDSIDNGSTSVTISGGTGDDTIENWSYSVTIDGGAGNDSIHNYGDSITIDGGAGDDEISLDSFAHNTFIVYRAGDGNDTVYGFDGDDTLKIYGTYSSATVGSDVVLTVGDGLGSISLVGAATLSTANIENDTNFIALTEGPDNYQNTLDGVTVAALGDNDSIYNGASGSSVGANVSIGGGAGDDSIRNYGENSTIDGGDDNDHIINWSDSVTIDGGDDNDTISNSGNSVTMDSGDGDDNIYTSGSRITINSGDGNDFIQNNADTVTINGGAGDDSIHNVSGSNFTIDAGAGNDLIVLYGTTNNLITYTLGDDNDKISGFNEDDTISIAGGQYVRSTVGNDLILTVGDGSISLVGAATLSTVNIIGTESVAPVASNFVSLTNGNDNYTVTVDGATVAALAGNDEISNEDDHANISISGGTGNDTIWNNEGTGSTIDGDAGRDYLANDGTNVIINGGVGNDTLVNTGATVTMNGGDGDDDFRNNGDSVTAYAGAGDDYVFATGNAFAVDLGDGNDEITTGGTRSSILGGAGSDTLFNSGTNTTLDGGNDSDWISNSGARSSILGGNGNDTIDNSGAQVSINAGAGNDSIQNLGASVTVDAGDDDDYILNTARGLQVSLNGGDGSDEMINLGANSTVLGGAGTDTIRNNAASVTLGGGRDDDTISLTGGASNNVIRYVSGDGNDVIWGYSANTTLNLINIAENAFSTVVSGNDVIIRFNNGGSMLLKDARDKPLNFTYGAEGTSGGTSGGDNGGGGNNSGGGGGGNNSGGGSNSGTSGGGSQADSGGPSSSGAGGRSDGSARGGNDSGVRIATPTRLNYTNVIPTTTIPTFPTTTSTATTTTPTVNTYVYTGGNQVISTYQQGERIIFGEVYTGAFYDAAGNLFVGSSTGALAVTNAVGKVVDLRDAWNSSFIKAYAAIYSGVIDGRGQAGFELINGAAGSDIIQAGDHGSQLWGGNDTATDALIGGGNSDIFIGGKNFGADTFLNASSADLVHLSDASLSDIVATAENNGTVGIAFNNGNVVTMQSTENISAAVMLADGNAYRYNHTNKSWQTA